MCLSVASVGRSAGVCGSLWSNRLTRAAVVPELASEEPECGIHWSFSLSMASVAPGVASGVPKGGIASGGPGGE